MNDKKNIDRLFQEKFKDFEVAPNDAVWNRINESLPNKKKKRRVIALWWQIGGVAAAIALLLTAGVSMFNSVDNSNKDLPIVNTDKIETNKANDNLKTSTNSEQDELQKTNGVEKIKYVDSEADNNLINKEGDATDNPKKDNVSNQLINSNQYQKESNAVANYSKEKEKINSSQKRNDLTTVNNKENSTKVAANTSNNSSKDSDAAQLANEKELKSTIKNTIEKNKTAVANNASSNKSGDENKGTEAKNDEELKSENAIIEEINKQDIKNAIVGNIIDEKEEEKQNRWSIAPNVAPVYYSSLGQGSSIGEQFNSNTKTSDINMSYGIVGSYAITKRLKVRTGVSRVNLSQSTSEVYAFTGPSISTAASRTSNIPIGGNITFNNNLPIASLMSAKLMQMPESSSPIKSGNLDQRFGFIEVPLELEYRIVDKKFGVNVIGGFSTFFLNQNEIYADLHGTPTLIGEANNINSTSYSANLGLGLDYSLSKQWNVNLEPTFKYQINTFNNTSGNFNPFFVGVYTGLSFKF
ncbi:hypothetical protein [uncultured Winogradskyella sp.]|uniref:hypothetical protein n=1 Tax=uncultured Winogradskyella sp. TaxID=395353 RepID=UPI002634B0EA|nr:hypothetical protein [uncultured Winogradskyella sp.]